MTAKRRVAVLFGGRSPEHDVSIVTGLQAMGAVDASAYDAFPVYISSQGKWFVGNALRDRANYLPDDNARRNLTEVMLDATDDGEGKLVPRKSGMFGRGKPVTFDVALLAFHGNQGEDGQIQGLFEMVGVPYTGMRTMASAALMDKSVTKRLLAGHGIPQLDCAVLRRPSDGVVLNGAAVAEAVGNAKFPACVKPCHLGSSIGVAKVDDMAELRGVLPSIFRLDPVEQRDVLHLVVLRDDVELVRANPIDVDALLPERALPGEFLVFVIVAPARAAQAAKDGPERAPRAAHDVDADAREEVHADRVPQEDERP